LETSEISPTGNRNRIAYKKNLYKGKPDFTKTLFFPNVWQLKLPMTIKQLKRIHMLGCHYPPDLL